MEQLYVVPTSRFMNRLTARISYNFPLALSADKLGARLSNL